MTLTVYEGGCATPPPTPGTFQVRAKYKQMADAGHLYGPFASREAAEACALALAGRESVQAVTIETL
jgi:hypothetical protein